MNVLDPIARLVRAYPDRPALHARGQTLSFRRLWQAAGLVAHHLHEKGVRAGDGVALSRNPPHIHLIAIIAIARIGAVSTSIPPSMPVPARREVVRRHGIRFWIHGEPQMPAVPSIRFIPESELLAPAAQGSKPLPLAQGLDDRTWRITFSSGTTGTSKSIPWTHRQRATLERNSLDAFAGGPGECLLVCADLGIGFGLGQAMTHLASGGSIALPDNASAAACVEALRTLKPTRLLMTTALAFTLADHLKKQGQEGPFSGLLSMLIGGSAVSPALMESLETLVCPNVQVSYGSTELGSTAKSTPATRVARPGAAGRLMPWIEAEAVNERHEALAPGASGLLRFRSRNGGMATQYLGDANATAASFRDGWFYPGDIGSIDAEGYLTLGGRSDDVVNVAGRKVAPAAVEKVLNEQAGVIESAVVAIEGPNGGRMLAGAVVTDGQADLQAIRASLAEAGQRLRVLVGVDALPKNANGKVMRQELAKRLSRAIADKRDR